MTTILVVEDDLDLNRAACLFLNDNGFKTISCKNGLDGLSRLLSEKIDLILSDIMMPEMDGFAFAEQVKSIDKDVPILFMSAVEDLESKQRGYKLGIDDYIVKPIQMEELVMKVTAILRRANISTSKKLVIGDLVLDQNEVAAYVRGENIELTVKEFNILFKLLSYPKRTFTRHQLMDEFWGFESESSPRTVDVTITKLRVKLSVFEGVEIQTVRGLGYKVVILL